MSSSSDIFAKGRENFGLGERLAANSAQGATAAKTRPKRGQSYQSEETCQAHEKGQKGSGGTSKTRLRLRALLPGYAGRYQGEGSAAFSSSILNGDQRIKSPVTPLLSTHVIPHNLLPTGKNQLSPPLDPPNQKM